MCLRIGQGYDVHRLVEGRKLILGGVDIPFGWGLLGHSDADVLCHAVTDALLGALALGDIGVHFPPSDPKFKDISSLLLLEQVVDLLRERSAKVVNIDSTIVAERPALGPYVPLMVHNLVRVLQIGPEWISIKVTTAEGLGALGRGEGIAAGAVALVEQQERQN